MSTTSILLLAVLGGSVLGILMVSTLSPLLVLLVPREGPNRPPG